MHKVEQSIYLTILAASIKINILVFFEVARMGQRHLDRGMEASPGDLFATDVWSNVKRWKYQLISVENVSQSTEPALGTV